MKPASAPNTLAGQTLERFDRRVNNRRARANVSANNRRSRLSPVEIKRELNSRQGRASAGAPFTLSSAINYFFTRARRVERIRRGGGGSRRERETHAQRSR